MKLPGTGKRKSVKTPNQPRFLQLRVRKATGTIAAVLGCLLVLAFAAGTANAQTFQSANTNTQLWAGVFDVTVSGPGGVTVPTSGVILHGTAPSQFRNPKDTVQFLPDGVTPNPNFGTLICQDKFLDDGVTPNPAFGTCLPVRHLWYGDAINGLCRVDPEVDAPLSTPVNGFGAWNVNALACLISVNKVAIAPGQSTFDAQNNLIYMSNVSRIAAGFVRVHYHPDGDNGQGMVDLIQVDSLLGTQSGRNALGGCPQLKDPKTGIPVPIVPNAAALGPDGALYGGGARDGAIMRINHAATFNPATDCPGAGSSGQGATDGIQIPMVSHDELFGAGHVFGLGWVGHTLIGADNIAPWVEFNADQCLTPANGNTACANPLFGGSPIPNEILASAAGAPQGGLASDAQYPFFPGNSVYIASFPNLTRVTNILSATQMSANLVYGGSFSFLTGVTADPEDPANATVYAEDDATQGGINGTGRIWRITPAPAAPGPPATPAISSATAGPLSGQATIGWTPIVNGQVTTTYNIEVFLASPTGGPATDTGLSVAITAPATSGTISNLTPGTQYQFEVDACNTTGCSTFSPISPIVTPFTQTVPAIPTNVVGVATGDGSSIAVAWTQNSNGHAAITSSAISAFTGSPAALVSTTTILGTGTGGTVGSLACGPTTSYQFSVTQTNAIGTSGSSALSAPVPLPCVTAADVIATETSPANVNAGSQVTYTITLHNNGPAVAPVVSFNDILPAGIAAGAGGAPLFTTSQGICTGQVSLTTFNCNVGSIPVAGTATVTVTVLLPVNQTGSFTNSATVAVTDGTGANVDPNQGNNTFTSTTTVAASNCTASAADIQVTGSSNNGNPVHGSPVTFTWQIKNGTGSINAACVNFQASTTAPSGASLSQTSFTTTQGACSISGNIVSCTLGAINGGGAATVTVSATPSNAEPANSYTTTGSASQTNGQDPNTANNQFTVSIGAQ